MARGWPPRSERRGAHGVLDQRERHRLGREVADGPASLDAGEELAERRAISSSGRRSKSSRWKRGGVRMALL